MRGTERDDGLALFSVQSIKNEEVMTGCGCLCRTILRCALARFHAEVWGWMTMICRRGVKTLKDLVTPRPLDLREWFCETPERKLRFALVLLPYNTSCRVNKGHSR